MFGATGSFVHFRSLCELTYQKSGESDWQVYDMYSSPVVCEMRGSERKMDFLGTFIPCLWERMVACQVNNLIHVVGRDLACLKDMPTCKIS